MLMCQLGGVHVKQLMHEAGMVAVRCLIQEGNLQLYDISTNCTVSSHTPMHSQALYSCPTHNLCKEARLSFGTGLHTVNTRIRTQIGHDMSLTEAGTNHISVVVEAFSSGYGKRFDLSSNLHPSPTSWDMHPSSPTHTLCHSPCPS